MVLAVRGKALAIFVCVAAVFALAAACGGSDTPNTPISGGSPAATIAGTTSPEAGGSITVQALQPQSFDPHFSGTTADISVERMLWRGLYRLDKSNKPVPEMATGQPEVSADSLTYTIKLQSDLKWSDGTPLTADDFVAGIIRTCAPATTSYYVSFLYNIVGCEKFAEATDATGDALQALQDNLGVSAPDATTIVFTLIHPQATFEVQLAMWYTFPVPRQVVKEPATDAWPTPTALAFNGPFMVKSYTEKSEIVLVRNPHYQSTSSHQAYLDQVTEKYIEDTEQANNAFRAGQLDEARANVQQLAALKSDASTKDAFFAPTTATTTLGLQMQIEQAPLDNEKVRIALSQAINREQFNTVVNGGAFTTTTSWIPAELVGIQPDAFQSQIGYDPAAAKKSLADAGYPEGKEFPTLTLEIRDDQANKAAAAFLQDAFKTILNITLDIKTVDARTLAMDRGQKNFQLLIGGWTQDYPDPEDWIDGQFNSDGSQNFTGCNNPQLDELFAKAKVNLDNDARIDQYRQINEIIATTVCGIAPIWNQPAALYLINPKITGMRENSTGQDFMVAGDWNAESWALAK